LNKRKERATKIIIKAMEAKVLIMTTIMETKIAIPRIILSILLIK
jgi:hypothetical protein